jgi:hypothetical protein
MVAELGSPEAAREEHAYTLGVQAYLWAIRCVPMP